jgi:putative hydrolase of the HAD superfamily
VRPRFISPDTRPAYRALTRTHSGKWLGNDRAPGSESPLRGLEPPPARPELHPFCKEANQRRDARATPGLLTSLESRDQRPAPQRRYPLGVSPPTRLERPDVVFLDLGDTLVRAHPSWVEVYAQAFPTFGVEIARDDFQRAFSEAFEEGENEGPFEATEEASYRRLKELDGRVFAKLGYPDLPDEFFRRVEQAFAADSSWWVFPDVIPALDALVDDGIRLAVISNWSWQAPELIHDLELARHFEALIISARVGYLKPHRGIFEHALGVMRVPPDRAVHVGDSVRADVDGARAVGITPVLIDRSTHVHAHSNDELPRDVPVIGDLFGLLDLLDVARPAAAAVSRAG